jgi:hypothetical protein
MLTRGLAVTLNIDYWLALDRSEDRDPSAAMKNAAVRDDILLAILGEDLAH